MINKDILIRGNKLPEGWEEFAHDMRTQALKDDRPFSKTGFVTGLIRKEMERVGRAKKVEANG